MKVTDEKRPFLASDKVPKRVFQIWLGDAPPPRRVEKMMLVVRGICFCLGWEYCLVDDAQVRMRWGGDRIWGEALGRCCHLSQRANVIRYLLLREIGGVYLDADVELYRLPEGLHGAWVCSSSVVTVNNFALACPPSDPFFKRVLDRCADPDFVDLSEDCAAGWKLLTREVDSPDCPPVNVWPRHVWLGGEFGRHHYMRRELGSNLKP